MDNYCDFYFPLAISFQIAQRIIETTHFGRTVEYTDNRWFGNMACVSLR